MEKRVYELKKGVDNTITQVDFVESECNQSSLYLFDIKTENRTETSAYLQTFGLPPEVCANMLEPEHHIRFDYYGTTIYGELAYFSEKTMQSQFVSIVSFKNMFFAIHEINEGILDKFVKTYPSFTQNQKNKLDAEFILYILLNEILSINGRLILAYREEVETLALDFDNKYQEINPNDILEAKSDLANFSRVLEKLFYTLSFPPTVDLLDQDSPYRLYFKELLTTMGYLKISLSQTEERLNSLSDHFNLILQDKSNKRLNFLTIIQAIFVPLTLIAGIFGMNFTYMPELELKYGYFFSLAAMVLVALIFLRYFHKHGWFE